MRSKRRQGMLVREFAVAGLVAATLGLIALQDFMKASVATNLGKVGVDQKNIAIAIEAYNVDANAYPPLWGDFGSRGVEIVPGFALGPLEEPLNRLSSPVAYLPQGPPTEPFNARQGWMLYEGWNLLTNVGPPPDAATRRTLYSYMTMPPDQYMSGLSIMIQNYFSSAGGFITQSDIQFLISRKWYVVSPGPDGNFSFDTCTPQLSSEVGCFLNYFVGSGLFPDNLYDPTNGLVSSGDIVRFHQTPPPTPTPNGARYWTDYR